MIWTKEQAKTLLDRVLSFSKAESTAVNLTGGDRANVRFARTSAARTFTWSSRFTAAPRPT